MPRKGTREKETDNRERAFQMNLRGMRVAEISETLGVTERTVFRYLSEARKNVRKVRQGKEEDDFLNFVAEQENVVREIHRTLGNLPIDSPQRTGLLRLLSDVSEKIAKAAGVPMNNVNLRHTGGDGKSPISVQFNWAEIAQEVEKNRVHVTEQHFSALTDSSHNDDTVDAEYKSYGDD